MKQLDLEMNLPSSILTFEDFDKVNSELNEFLKTQEGELVGPPIRQEVYDLDLLSQNNITLNSNQNPFDENSSIITMFDKIIDNYKIKLEEELEKELVFPKRQHEWNFNNVNADLNRYLTELGEEQLEPVIEKLKENYISNLEEMLSNIDLTSFQGRFVNSLSNNYFYDVLYGEILDDLSKKISKDKIKLETHLSDFEQGFVEPITKREVFIDTLKENDFASYFFKSKNCQNQMISTIEGFIDEKDTWGAAVFLSRYVEIMRNQGNNFTEENKVKINHLRQRYKNELLSDLLFGYINKYKNECFTDLKRKEKQLREINDIKKLNSIYDYGLLSFYSEDFEIFISALGDNFSVSDFEDKSKQIKRIKSYFFQRLEDKKQARENQLKRIQILEQRRRNTLQTTTSTLEVEEQKPKINLDELLKNTTYNANIEEDRVGKVILTYDIEKNGFHLITGGIKEEGFYFVVNKDPEKFRDFVRTSAFNNTYGMHKDIKRPDSKTLVFGGGAYFTEGNRIHIDYKSGDFGNMNLEVVRKCVETSGYKLTIMDEKYFDDTPVINLLKFIYN